MWIFFDFTDKLGKDREGIFMDKKALVDKLQKEGYSVTLEGNVPMFTLSKELSIEQIKKLLEKYDYTASFGYRKAVGSVKTVEKPAKVQKEKTIQITEEEEAPLFVNMPDFQTETDGQYSLF